MISLRVSKMAIPLLALALVVGAGTAAAQDECIEFDGLTHCAVGEASLEVSDEGLKVGFRKPGSGFGVDLKGVNNWSAELEVFTTGSGADRLVTSAIAGGQESAALNFQELDGGLGVTPCFLGERPPETFSLMIFNQGRLVGSVGRLRNDLPIIELWFPDPWCVIWDIRFPPVWNGARQWVVQTRGTVPVTLGNLRWEGDEIRMIEELPSRDSVPLVNPEVILFRGSVESINIERETYDRH
jgi:hypothetical protein